MKPQEIDDNLKSHFLNLYSIALSDTQIDTTELELLYKFGKERGVTQDDIAQIILHPAEVEFTIPDDVLQKIEYLYDFARMIWADKKVDEFEEIALRKFCLKFGFEEQNVPTICEFLIDEAKKETPQEEVIAQVKENL